MAGRLFYLALISIFISSSIFLNGGIWPYLILLVTIIRLIFLGHKRLLIGALILLLVQLFWSLIYQHHHLSKLSGQEEDFVVYYSPDQAKISGDLLNVQVEVAEGPGKKEKLQLFYRFKNPDEKEQLLQMKQAHYLTIQGKLEQAEKARNLNTFDYQAYLKSQNISWILSVEELKVIKPSSLTWRDWRFRVRQQIESIPYPRVSDYSLALVLNDQTALAPDVKTGYQKLGLIHLFSISGLHIQIIVGNGRRLLKRSFLSLEAIDLCVLILLPIYGSFCLWTPGIFRAIISQLSRIITRYVGIKNWTSIDGTALAAILALLIKPNWIMSLGFQLSFWLTLMLLLMIKALENFDLKNWFKEFSIGLLMQLASLPFVLYHYFSIPLLALALNTIILEPFTKVLIPLLFLLVANLLFLPILPLWHLLAIPLEFVLNNFENILIGLGQLRISQIIIGRPHDFYLFLMVASLIGFLLALDFKHKKRKHYILLCLIFFFSIPISRFSPFGRLVFVDVGQGDCILYQSPWRTYTLVIDLAGKLNFEKEAWQERSQASYGERIVLPALKALGVHQIDDLVITHADVDHMGSVVDVNQEIPIKNIILGPGLTKHPELIEILKVVNQKEKGRINLKTLKVGQALFQKGQDQLFYLYPSEDSLGSNNDSVILYGRIGQYKWLFTGDLEEVGEAKLIKDYPNLQTDVLKVGHHGSKTSSSKAFIEQVKPKIAVITAGKNNSFGHPHTEVLSTLNQVGAQILRTDLHGAIHYNYLAKQGQWFWLLDNKESEENEG